MINLINRKIIIVGPSPKCMNSPKIDYNKYNIVIKTNNMLECCDKSEKIREYYSDRCDILFINNEFSNYILNNHHRYQKFIKLLTKYKVQCIFTKRDMPNFDKIPTINISQPTFYGALSSVILIKCLQQFTKKITVCGFDMYGEKGKRDTHEDYIEGYIPNEIVGRDMKKHREKVHDLDANEKWFKSQEKSKKIIIL